MASRMPSALVKLQTPHRRNTCHSTGVPRRGDYRSQNPIHTSRSTSWSSQLRVHPASSTDTGTGRPPYRSGTEQEANLFEPFQVLYSQTPWHPPSFSTIGTLHNINPNASSVSLRGTSTRTSARSPPERKLPPRHTPQGTGEAEQEGSKVTAGYHELSSHLFFRSSRFNRK